jgi:16S rRNA (guanine527-N7)-methyltransferase
MRPPDTSRESNLAAFGRAAAALDVELTAEQSDKLLGYLALLAKWNRTYNLSAIRDPAAMLVLHLLDSMAVVAPLRRWTHGRGARLLDVGSGAGLPGLVLGVLMPELDVTCIDAVGKKAAFVREASAALGLVNVHSVHGRAEEMATGAYDVVASRAFASLADFVGVTKHRCAENGVWMAMKGRQPTAETAALPADIEVFHVERLCVPDLDADRCLVWMRRRAAIPEGQ